MNATLCRAKAEECQREAEKHPTGAVRNQYEFMANAWRKLAGEAEKVQDSGSSP